MRLASSSTVLWMLPIELAKLCQRSYDTALGWNHWWVFDEVYVGHVKVEDVDILVLRGSVTATDWIRDAQVLPQWHSDIGFVHGGFLTGMDAVFEETVKVTGDRVIITGHSLGGARARILAGLRAIKGEPVDAVCTFGAPKPAFVNLRRVLEKSGMTHTSYRNRNDVVPMLPFLLYEHTEPWQSLDAAPNSTDLEALRDHSMALYVKGLSNDTTN